jgi:hypothetical protein
MANERTVVVHVKQIPRMLGLHGDANSHRRVLAVLASLRPTGLRYGSGRSRSTEIPSPGQSRTEPPCPTSLAIRHQQEQLGHLDRLTERPAFTSATRGRTYQVNPRGWRFGLCRSRWFRTRAQEVRPRPDVRCEQSRGAKLGGKPKTLLIHPGATGEGKIGRVCDTRSHALSERVDWRFDRDRRRSSGPVLVAWPRPDVRRR